MRRALRVLAGVVAVVLLALLAGLLWVRSALPPERGTIPLAGLSAPAHVWRDSLGVPHIRAAGVGDLLFAQGYVHAQDRLWQMELLRRAAEGRLSELFGGGMVSSDRFLHTLGLWRAAGAAEAALQPDVRALLESYAAGVNAWIADTRGALPPEYLLLRARPEPWTPRHSLAVEKIMAMDLSLYQTSLSATRAAARLGADALPVLVPGYPEWGGTTVDGPPLPEVPEPAAALLAAGSIAHASNAWVIGGAHTASGRPILANDMHLALRAPSLWYLAALHADRADGLPGGAGRALDVAGMTLPGVPFVIAGHTRAVAWGFTNAMVDDVELFVERLVPGDPYRYVTPGGAEPFRVRTDTIRVKGEAGVEHTVRSTRHGPVISDLDGRFGGDVVALRWLAHDSASSVRAFPALNLAEDADAVVAAVDAFENPHLNVVYADTAGAFGYVMGGRVPLRANGAPPTLLPVPGWSGEWDWTGELPFEAHPRTRSPARGYVVTANNRQAGGHVAEQVTTYWADPFRALRITSLVRAAIARGGVDADAVHRMQLDVVDARALRYRDRAVDAARAAGLGEEARRLAAWTGDAGSASVEAPLFYAWYEELRRALRLGLYGGEGGWLPGGAVDAAIERRALPLAGREAEWPDVARAAMAEAARQVRGRTLGELHTVCAEHAMSGVALLDRLLGLTVGEVPSGGTPATVNVAQWGSGPFPKVSSYGASQRHVVDMGDVDAAGGFILPTGQSGIPFSRHYRDQFGRWHGGGLWLVPLGREAAEARAVHRLRLVPEREGSSERQ